SMMDMKRYIFFDDAECSMTTNVNNASSSFYGQNDEIQKYNENRDKMKTSNMNKLEVSTMNESNYSNNQDKDELIDQFNVNLEE
ncbi:10144_t:CDS:1, partial [Dentiscutata erythropus]